MKKVFFIITSNLDVKSIQATCTFFVVIGATTGDCIGGGGVEHSGKSLDMLMSYRLSHYYHLCLDL